MVGERVENGLALLKRALNATQNGIMITDATAPDDPIVYVNRAFEGITGYRSEEVLGRNPRFLQAGNGDQPVLDDLRGVREAHNDDMEWMGVLRNYRKNGTLFYIELSAAAVRDEEGRATHHIGVISDVTKREQAEEKIRVQARLLDAVGRAVVALDLSGRVVYWNRAAEELYGWSAGEALGRLAEEVMVSEEQLGLAGEIWSELSAGRSWSGEFVVKRRDGTPFPAMVTDTPIFDERGDLVGVIGVSADITERKLAEEALREGNNLFRSVMEGTTDAVFVKDLEGRYTAINGAGAESLGRTIEEVLGRTDAELFSTEDSREIVADDREIMASGEARTIEDAKTTREGVTRTYLAAKGPYRDSTGRITGVFGVSRDITDRKRAEEELRESEQRFRALTEAALEGILITEGGVILEANRAYAEILEYELSEIIGRPVLDFAAAESVETVREKMASGTEERYEAVAYTKDGTRIYVEVNGRPSTYRGRAVRVTAIREVTERRRAEESLRESNRRLEELAVLRADFGAMVAHELGSPLAAVRAHAEVLGTGELGPKEHQQALEKIATETDILMALVADVRFAASVEREDFSLRIRTVAVGRLLDDAAAFAETLTGTHPFTVEAENPNEEVVADPYRIGQVLRNLLSNAAKYTPEGTPVTLRAIPSAGPEGKPASRATGRVIRIEIADSGPGIHPDDSRRVFEKFGRGRDREGRKVPGAGLGLYLSRRIVRVHGSDLSVRSVPGEGSAFSFILEAAPGNASG